MAARTRKAATPPAATTQPAQTGLTSPQSSLCSLLAGPKGAISLAEAQVALGPTGADASAVLHELVNRGFLFQNGQGLFALTRDASGNFAVYSGQPPVAHTLPPQTAATAQAQTALAAAAAEVDDQDDLPWTSGDLGVAICDKLDAILEHLAILTAGRTAPITQQPAVAAAVQYPSLPPPQQQQAPQQGYPAMPPQQPMQQMPPQQQWAPQGQAPGFQQQAPPQQPWNQPQFQQGQQGMAPPNPYPQQQQMTTGQQQYIQGGQGGPPQR